MTSVEIVKLVHLLNTLSTHRNVHSVRRKAMGLLFAVLLAAAVFEWPGILVAEFLETGETAAAKQKKTVRG